MKMLTQKELAVFTLLKDGYRPSDIAHLLFYSRATVVRYLRQIRHKLDADTLEQAVAIAYETGIFKVKGDWNEQLLAKHFDIDLNKAEEENRRMLDKIMADKAKTTSTT